MTTDIRYFSLSAYMKQRFGEKVWKAPIDAGFTCPTRDNTISKDGCAYCKPKLLIPNYHAKGRALSVTEQIDKGLEVARGAHNVQKVIAYFQVATNTYDKIERLREIYEEALAHPAVVGLSVSTRPDCVPDEVLDLLKELGSGGEPVAKSVGKSVCKDGGKRKRVTISKRIWVELGLQSAHDATLGRINRGHTAGDFKDAVERAAERAIDVCAHVIMGLPGESRLDMLETIRFIADLNVWGVKFHQLQIVKDTAFEASYKKGEITLPTLDEYVELVVESLELLDPRVVIHRLSGDTLLDYLVAPRWGGEKSFIRDRVTELLRDKKTRQGAKWDGA